jgi:tetratricopeptide (TPR) repeat protein
MGEQLTWLTLGNYLCALGHSDDAKYYLRYLKNALPKDHEILPSIFNNMGLIYAELGDHEKSLKYYDRAMRLFDKISRNTDHNTEEVQTQQSQREEAL